MKKKLIAPSILAADLLNLKSEILSVEKAGADWHHLDVMDGHFVPNITFGSHLVAAISSVTTLPLDVHLMVEEPLRWVESFSSAGADHITIHCEADKHIHKTLSAIKALGKKCGVSINPSTSLTLIEEILEEVDIVLMMSVNPGFGGQKFILNTLDRVERLSKMRNYIRSPDRFKIVVDGGINSENAAKLWGVGADVLVAGTAIFGQSNRVEAITTLRAEA